MNIFLLWYPYPSVRLPTTAERRVRRLPAQDIVHPNTAGTARLFTARALRIAEDAEAVRHRR